jgi:hypothetical protein
VTFGTFLVSQITRHTFWHWHWHPQFSQQSAARAAFVPNMAIARATQTIDFMTGVPI